MPPQSDVNGSWSKSRWVATVALAITIQFAVVVAFTLRGPIRRTLRPNTQVTLPESLSGELQALTDPTLLALGSAHGFSKTWMDIPTQPRVDSHLEQAPDWLHLDPQGLGTTFQAMAASHSDSERALAFRPAPQRLHGTEAVTTTPLRTTSTLRVKGDVEPRTLPAQPNLPSWPTTDVLQPSRVRVVVDGRGLVVSAILLSSSGLPSADQFALETARGLRFKPIRTRRDPSGGLSFGEAVFDWHTTFKQDEQDQAPGT